MKPRGGNRARAPSTATTRLPSNARFAPFTIGATAIALLISIYCALTWQDFTKAVGFCTPHFCDFIEYYYPMGEAVFRTEVPESGFLYSPFIAILLAVFPPLGLTASLFVWGILQVLFVILYLLIFRRLVPASLPIQLLFVALALSSYPHLLNFLGGQVSVFMTVALFGMLVVNQYGRRAAAAGLLAFAVSFKFYPIIFLAPYAVGRNTRFLFYGVSACLVFLFLIPSGLLGFSDTLHFYAGLFEAFRDSNWVAANPHSQYFPHLFFRLTGAAEPASLTQLSFPYLVTYCVAAANLGLLYLIQRARLRHADLWSFQIVFLTIPFVLKSSWPHDFVFLPFTQALLAWRILGNLTHSNAWRERPFRTRLAQALCFLLPSIAISNIVFFNWLGDFSRYGSYGFLFWANLLLLIALYLELLPPAIRALRERNKVSG